MSVAAAKRALLLVASLIALVAVSVAGAAGGAPPDKDRDAPSAPQNLRVSEVTQTVVRLAWDASSDNVAIAGYYLFGDRGKATLETGLDKPEYTVNGLSCGQSADLTIVAFDAAQNRSQKATLTVSSAPCSDTGPPTTPAGFTQLATSQDAVVLAWNPSVDNVGVVGYGVYRGVQPIASPTDPTVTLAGLACGSSYEYAVDAVDAAGNRSLLAKWYVQTSACSTTPLPPEPAPPPADTTPPSAPSGLAATNVSQNALTLSWNPSTDNIQVTGYDLYRDGTKVASPSTPGASQSGLACGTSYTFAIEALDAAGNRSARASLTTSTSACSTTPSPAPPPTDTQAPSMPMGLGVSSATRTSASLTWNPSTDNVAVAGYRTYSDGSYQSTTTQPTTTISGLSCGGAHTFEVDAFDATGNESNRASVVGSTLPCPDIQAPSAPAGVVASSRTATSIALTWSASSDNVGVTGYGLYRGGSLVGTGTTTTGIFAGLTCNTNYTLAVDAYDAAGNRSAKTTVMVSTTACPDTQAPSTPSGLAASGVTQTGLTLTWNPSTDSVGVTGYDVYRNNAKIASVASPLSNQTGLACGTSYSFAVAAYDAAGNRSQQAQLTASSAACSPPPPPAPPSLSTWYSPTSPWNTVLPASPAILADSARYVSSLYGSTQGINVNIFGWTPPVYYADASTPKVSIPIIDDWNEFRIDGVPMPSDARPSPDESGGGQPGSNDDNYLQVMDLSTGCEYDYWRAWKDSNGQWHAKNQASFTIGGSGVHVPWAVRASSIALGAGIFRPEEFQAGVINHALGWAIPNSVGGTAYVSPAQRSDGLTPGGIPMGTLFQLDPNLDLNSFQPALAPWQMILARAMQRYGVYTTDSSVGVVALQGQSTVSMGATQSYPFPRYSTLPRELILRMRAVSSPVSTPPVDTWTNPACAQRYLVGPKK